MLTTPWDWPSLDTAYIIWCFGALTMLTHWLLFPHDKGHEETPACWSLHHQVMWMAVRKPLKKTPGAVHIRGGETQLQYYDRKTNVISLEPGDLVLAKANAYRERRKSEGPVGGRTVQSGVSGCWGHPFLLHEEPADRMLMSVLIKTGLFLIAPIEGTPLCTVMHTKWARCTTTTQEEQTLEDSETEGSVTKCKLYITWPSIRQVRLL